MKIVLRHGDNREAFTYGSQESRVTNQNDTLYYSQWAAANENCAPVGWKVASSSDYKNLQSTLVYNGISTPALALNPQGVTGFEAEYSGWCASAKWSNSLYDNIHRKFVYVNDSDQAEYYTSDSYHVRLTKSGAMAVEEVDAVLDDYARSIRMVQK
jgi:hypothetical protein